MSKSYMDKLAMPDTSSSDYRRDLASEIAALIGVFSEKKYVYTLVWRGENSYSFTVSLVKGNVTVMWIAYENKCIAVSEWENGSTEFRDFSDALDYTIEILENIDG